MADGKGWSSYVNGTVFKDVRAQGISMDTPWHISSGNLSSLDFLNTLKNAGWWWPSEWYRQNRNIEHAGGTDIEREVEAGKWIHITVFPGQREESRGSFFGIKLGTKTVDDWSKPPRDIQLHCERYWFRPTSGDHLRDFLHEKTIEKPPF